jgi:hypothetical protein
MFFGVVPKVARGPGAALVLRKRSDSRPATELKRLGLGTTSLAALGLVLMATAPGGFYRGMMPGFLLNVSVV